MKTQKYPYILELHLGHSCRLNCTFCYRNGGTYRNHRMPICGDTLKKLIVDFAESGGRELYISGGLEPFADYEMVCHTLLLANKAGLKLRVYTNGAEPVLQKKWIQELLICTTDQIRFSVHARSENIYSKITGVQDARTTFTLVKENVLALLGQREKAGPKIGISFVVNETNIAELNDAATFWSKFGVDFMDVRFDVLAADDQNNKFEHQLNIFQHLVESNAFSPMQINVGDFKQGKPTLPKWCSAPFSKIVVDRFGLVWPCCLLAQPGSRPSWACLGSLADQRYSDIMRKIPDKFPRRHCGTCTPFEIKQNSRLSLAVV
jgi:MoaA/NifB/PqqE/SkfB family radical SAM enzyme